MMKRKKIQIGLVMMMAMFGLTLVAHAQPKPAKKLVTGTVKCLFCHVSGKKMGDDAAACQVHCLEAKGMLPIIVEEGTNEIYIVLLKDGKSAKEKMVPMMETKVNAQGPVYVKDGVKVMELDIVSEAL